MVKVNEEKYVTASEVARRLIVTPIEDTLTSKLVHVALITLIVVYVVFVEKNRNTVESVY